MRSPAMRGKRKSAPTLWKLLGEVPDRREAQGRRYPLRGLLAVAIAATLAGRTSLAGIARWGAKLKKGALRAFGLDRDRTPCHASWHYLFRRLDTDAVERILAVWVRSLGGDEEPGHVAIDGKTLRGSRSGEYPGVHLLAAYCERAQGVLGELRVGARENEIPAALRLLKKMPLKGAVVTGDAIFAQKAICRRIVGKGGDYFLAVKENQPQLKRDIEEAFAPPASPLRAEAS